MSSFIIGCIQVLCLYLNGTEAESGEIPELCRNCDGSKKSSVRYASCQNLCETFSSKKAEADRLVWKPDPNFLLFTREGEQDFLIH